MSWDITTLMVHLAALVLLVLLARRPPDPLQFMVVWTLILAFCIHVAAAAIALSGGYVHWSVSRIALQLEHVAVLLYVFRLFYLECVCKNSQPRSRPSPR